MFIRFLCAFVSTILFSVSPGFSQSSSEHLANYRLRPMQEGSMRARDIASEREARVFELTREADKKIKAAADMAPDVRTANRTSENRYDDAITALNTALRNRGESGYEELRQRAETAVGVAREATNHAKTVRATAQDVRDSAIAARDHAADLRVVASRAREAAKAARDAARHERDADREVRERARADMGDEEETQADQLWNEADGAWNKADFARDYADDMRNKADDARKAADQARNADEDAREAADQARVKTDQKIEAAFEAIEAATHAWDAAVEAVGQLQQIQPGTQAHVDAKERAERLVAEVRTLTQTSDEADKAANAAIEAIKELDGAAIETKRAAESAEQIARNKEHAARQKEDAAKDLEKIATEMERTALEAKDRTVDAIENLPEEDIPVYENFSYTVFNKWWEMVKNRPVAETEQDMIEEEKFRQTHVAPLFELDKSFNEAMEKVHTAYTNDIDSIERSHSSEADKSAARDKRYQAYLAEQAEVNRAFNAKLAGRLKKESKHSEQLMEDFKQIHSGTGGDQAEESTSTKDPLKEISPEDAEILRNGMENIVKLGELAIGPGWGLQKPKGIMPQVPGDKWDFLPEYKPGESIYEKLEEKGLQASAEGEATGGQIEAEPTGGTPEKPADLRPSQWSTGISGPAETTPQGQPRADTPVTAGTEGASGTGASSMPLEQRLKKESKHSKQLMEDFKRRYSGESGEEMGPTVTEHPDGRITTEYPGGGTATRFLDGTSEFVMPQPKGEITITRWPDNAVSTTTTTTLENGTMAFTTQNPDGTYTLELYDSDGTYTKTVPNKDGGTTTRTTHPDGRVKETRSGVPDAGPGTTVIPNPDRGFTIVTRNKDGSETRTTTNREGTSSVTTWPDGRTSITTGTLRDDGTKTFTSTNPDGTRTVEAYSSDGSYTVDVPNPDGTRTIDRTDPNGSRTRKTVNQNGKMVVLETMSPDGTWTSSTQDPQGGFTDSSQAAVAGPTSGRTSPGHSSAVSGVTGGSTTGGDQVSVGTPPPESPPDQSKTRDRDTGKTEGSGSPGDSTSAPWTRRGPEPVTTVPR
jgi:hypothetical protein